MPNFYQSSRRWRRHHLGLILILQLTQSCLAADDTSNLFLRGTGDVGVNSGNVLATASSSSQASSDGICSNYGTTGYHTGTYSVTLDPSDSPNGLNWTWEQCAAECCARDISQCSFWTLQLNPGSNQFCLLMTNQGSYSDTGGHIEGDRDEDCCFANPTAPGAWRFVWSDEFDGADGDPLDGTTWGYETGYVRNNEAQYYSTRLQNSRIDDGHALIEARRDSWNGHEYTSASRTTRNKRSFLYGRFALRARIDVRAGSWPAWWWLPDAGGWPQGGEIDMMEYYQNKVLFNVMDGQQRWTSVQPSLDDFPGGGAEWSKHFHTWTFDWSPDKIKLYLDGVLMNDYDVSNADGTGPNGVNPFRQPGYLLMNQAIGGTAGGDPSSTDFPVRYRVDWIRQWEWDGSVATENAVTVTVNGGAGSGAYEVGTKATAAAGQPPVGQVFDRWSIVSGGSSLILDDPLLETTTFAIPSSSGGQDIVLQANFILGNPPTDSPVAGPTPPPVDPLDGVCSKYTTDGWHIGIYELSLDANQAPNGSKWEWEECARECALFEACEFWTLPLGTGGQCHLMSNQGDYVVSSNHAEGDKDMDCAVDVTPSPTAPPTTPPTPSPTTNRPTTPPTLLPTIPPTHSPTTNTPTTSPTSASPTKPPTVSPTQSPNTKTPTTSPSPQPTSFPTGFSCSNFNEAECIDPRCEWIGRSIKQCQEVSTGCGLKNDVCGLDEDCCSGNCKNNGRCS
mmetsp:Transcript_39047/g.82123  ORF Transcript_39047/g.82123 Transcript_39047/m.82123 type:complete len:731 (+) Transcript_39047:94-2286(+)